MRSQQSAVRIRIVDPIEYRTHTAPTQEQRLLRQCRFVGRAKWLWYEVEREIEALLRQRHRIRGDAPNDFRIENPADVLIARGAAVRILGILLIAVAAVSLVVGGISVMNIMLVSVTERTREIGLRMAIGASRRDIRWQFLIEALILALMGGLVGAVLGAAAAVAIAWKAGWPILISPWAMILACGFAGFIGISFGLYPAHRAARLDPIVALRFE
jgi:putative ABC transport system permease protein